MTVRLIVAGVLLASTSACGDKVPSSESEACMEAARETITEKIDAGTNGEQVHQDAMNDCGLSNSVKPSATSYSPAPETSTLE